MAHRQSYFVGTILFSFCVMYFLFSLWQLHSEERMYPTNTRHTRRMNNPTTSFCNHNASRLGIHQKVVSFSLFANNENCDYVLKRYMPGILLNLKKIRELYPGWTMRIYTNISDSDTTYFKDVQSEEDLFICDVTSLPVLEDVSKMNGMVWRFLPLFDPTVDIFLIRDLDSAVNERERAAVKQWEESDKVFHTMRDHPDHVAVVMGGLWGAKNYLIDDDTRAVFNYIFSKVMNSKMNDQDVVAITLYFPFKSLFMVHDSYLCQLVRFGPTIPFPEQRLDTTHFVGGTFLPESKNVSVCPEACRPEYGKDWVYC